MYALGRYVHLPARYLERGLIMTGGGAGIAAAFNTPLAGVIFALEVVLRHFAVHAFAPIAIASVAGSRQRKVAANATAACCAGPGSGPRIPGMSRFT